MKHMTRTVIAAVAILIVGCEKFDLLSARPAEPPPAAADNDRQARYAAKAAAGAAKDVQSESAVETALVWAQKHADVSAKLAAAERENRGLAERNQSLQQQLDSAKQQLAAAQRELNEANAMMKDLDARLSKWQESVLGYRQEMREAQKAQMEALGKVIKLLGGEVPAGPPATQPAGAAAKEANHVAP
jgi:hypothetical protein